jgi:hypothetical protein
MKHYNIFFLTIASSLTMSGYLSKAAGDIPVDTTNKKVSTDVYMA